MNPLRALLCTAWFVVGCVALVALAFHPRYRYRISYVFGRYVSPLALSILGIEVIVENPERLRTGTPSVIIANHQHLFDIFLMAWLLPPRTITVGKQSIRWVPIFGWLFHRAGNLLIDRAVNEKAMRVMELAHRQIKERGLSVVVMPEGTRSRGRGLLPFKKGAFHLAIGTQLPLLPIAISPFHGVLNFWRWRAGTLRVNVLPPIPTGGLTVQQVPELMADARARMEAALAGFASS